jgi:heavy metal translocating P-type ATPase
LDAAAIGMGFLQGNGSSAGRSMYLLHVAEALEDYTQRRSSSSLAQSLMAIPTAARKLDGDLEIEVALDTLVQGDVVVARLGDSIPVDGTVIGGQAAVNQSSLTGEPLAIMRGEGDSVYAGTVVEDGEIRIQITGNPQASKIRSIVTMMEQSDALKSARQKRIESMADKLVPWNFLLAGVVALTTRSISKTAAALMVDYSCALKLSGSIAVMAAQRESAKHGFIVKGSRFFDAMAEADVIVFDKTGTLTAAEPSVCMVESYCEDSPEEILRLAACFEEHFPHPVARAVVNKALEQGLEHRERHAEVEYIIAHGIASSIDGKRAVIGSEHFVLEDEHIAVAPDILEKIHRSANGTSPLLMAIDGVLAGVIYIEDPLKPGTKEVVDQLRALGFKRIIMLTGDNAGAAQKAALAAGVDEFQANLLPEYKHAFVQELQAAGHKVAMIGDGVNDAPALAAAHVSIAMSGGSAVAREAADISLVSDNLGALVELRRLCCALQKRMAAGYRFTIGFNSLLLALGISGLITPQVSSLAHNGSTVALSTLNARSYLPEVKGGEGEED